jgi:hypothetical protein
MGTGSITSSPIRPNEDPLVRFDPSPVSSPSPLESSATIHQQQVHSDIPSRSLEAFLHLDCLLQTTILQFDHSK